MYIYVCMYVCMYVCIYVYLELITYCGCRVVESLLLLLAIPEIILCLRKASFFMMSLEAHEERSFS